MVWKARSSRGDWKDCGAVVEWQANDYPIPADLHERHRLSDMQPSCCERHARCKPVLAIHLHQHSMS